MREMFEVEKVSGGVVLVIMHGSNFHGGLVLLYLGVYVWADVNF